MSPRTAWTIRIGAVLASAPICYLALVTIDSRSPWLLTAVIPVGFVLGEIVRRLRPPDRQGYGRSRLRQVIGGLPNTISHREAVRIPSAYQAN